MAESDEIVQRLGLSHRNLPPHSGTTHNALDDARWTRDVWRFLNDYEAARRITLDLGMDSTSFLG